MPGVLLHPDQVAETYVQQEEEDNFTGENCHCIIFRQERCIPSSECEWKICFQAHHDGRTWTKLESGFDQARYNLRHTDLLWRCAQNYINRGYFVTLEKQTEFRIEICGAAVSGQPSPPSGTPTW